MDLPYLRKLFAYDDWANRTTLASLRAAGRPSERSLRLMAHIIAAEWLWHARLLQQRSAMPVSPELTLAECEEALPRLCATWREYLDALTPARLAGSIAYVNTKGESWTNTVGDVLVHVVMHGGYHRGQIAADLRAHGFEPAYTDFIEGIRRGIF